MGEAYREFIEFWKESGNMSSYGGGLFTYDVY